MASKFSGFGPTGDPRDRQHQLPTTEEGAGGPTKNHPGQLQEPGADHGPDFKSGINAAEKPHRKK